MNKLISFKNKTLDFFYKYRFIIAIVLLIIGVLLKLHGSSIGLWNSVYNTGVQDNSLLWGTLRSIRSDEWAVTTPFIFSQAYNGFKYFTDIIRGGTLTDTFSLYGLPVLSIVEIFRPFHLGFIFLGIERGLSFFWIARFIALFLVTFEFGMIFTNKNKRLSLIGAFMVSLSPIVQWWFATNGTVEVFVFGELALIMLHKYMNTDNFKSRLIFLFFMMVCAGGYILILYPPFQIPLFYVFLFLAIWVIVDNRKKTKINYKDIISIIITLLIFISLMTYIFYMSKDTIIATLNTEYPGSRAETGGGAFRKYISYIDNIFLPYKEEGLVTYNAEEAVMFGLFPIGIICSILVMIKNKKIDLLIILLFIPYIIIGIFCIIGFPEWLAKITLLSFSNATRGVIALGFIDILLLIRSLSLTEKTMKFWKALITSIILSAIVVFICHKLNPEYVGWILTSFLFVMCCYLFFFGLQYNTKYGKYLFTIGIICTMLVAGFTVNPVSYGLDMVNDSPILNAAKEINNEESGIWLVDAISFPGPNYLVMAGVPTINSTHAYPNFELCKKLDPEGKYEEVYNRYAHIYMEVVESEQQISEKFVLVTPDIYRIYITPDELKELNIKYIFTVRVMEDFANENISFDLIYNENSYHIYKVNYNN